MTNTHSSPTRRLDGRTAIVTGSTSGIGAASAVRLTAAGSRILITGRDTTRGNQVVADTKPAEVKRRSLHQTSAAPTATCAGSPPKLRLRSAEPSTSW